MLNNVWIAGKPDPKIKIIDVGRLVVTKYLHSLKVNELTPQ